MNMIKTAKTQISHFFEYCYKSPFVVCAYVLLIVGILSRCVLYFDARELWLDEASLSLNIFQLEWRDLIGKPLIFGQAAPLGFLVVTRIFAKIFGYSELVLRILPFFASIGLLIVMFKLAVEMFVTHSCANPPLHLSAKNNNSAYIWVCITLIALITSKSLLYYAAEFKQYEVEAFCSALLVYLFVRKVSLRIFLFASFVCLLFGNGIVFVIFGLLCGYMYRSIKASNLGLFGGLKQFIMQNLISFLVFGIFFFLLYFGYTKPQAVKFFFDFWSHGFLPLNPKEFFLWVNENISIFTEFAFGGKKIVAYLLLITSLIGLFAMYRYDRALCIGIAAFIVVYMIASFAKIMPISIDGGILHGTRLALFWEPIYVLGCVFGLRFIASKILIIAESKLSPKNVKKLVVVGGGGHFSLFASCLWYQNIQISQ
ncbi:hypothetical protein [Helicobacter fennelliae]